MYLYIIPKGEVYYQMNSTKKLKKPNFFFTKGLSYILSLALLISVAIFNGYPISASSSDYSVVLSLPQKVEQGEQFHVTVTVTDIIAPVFEEGQGIFGVEIYLYYDSEYFTPVENSFSASVPSKWDGFDGNENSGVWGLFSVFDGKMTNGATNDGDISFTVSFTASPDAPVTTAHFYIDNCECTGYSSSALLKMKSYTSTAYCHQTLNITDPEILTPSENAPFTFDRESGIIYSETPQIDFDTFSNQFSHTGGTITITAFDYSVTSENGEFIPNGATVSVFHEPSGRTFEFTYYLLGDCDCNGKVNVADLAIIKNVIINSIPTEGYVKYAMEFEKDGVTRIADYLRLKLYIASK